MLGPIAARLGEGMVVQLSADTIKQVVGQSEQTDTAHIIRHNIEELRKHNHYQKEYLKMLYELLSKECAAPIDEIVMLHLAPAYYQVDTKGLRYNLILAAATLSIDITVAGVGTYTVSLAAGWNSIDAPDDAQITVSASGSDTSVLFRRTNTLMKV